jgi:hypothetical protein
MKPYTAAKTFQARIDYLSEQINKLDVDVAAVEVELATLKRGDKDCAKKRAKHKQMQQRVIRYKQELQNTYELTTDLWYLVQFLVSAWEEEWTPKQVKMWNKPTLNSNEGRGEEPLHDRYEIEWITSSSEDCDLVLRNASRLEVKNIEGRSESGRLYIQAIQISKTGRHAYSDWVFEQAEGQFFVGRPEEVRKVIKRGEIGPSVIKSLPDDIRQRIMEMFRPSIVLQSYHAIVCGTMLGSLTIPREDFDDAWELTNITKMSPKYILKKEYVVAQLNKTMVTPHGLSFWQTVTQPRDGSTSFAAEPTPCHR